MPQPTEPVDGVAMPELYVRTYMTLLRSSGNVRVRALEAAHMRMRSSLHLRAEQTTPDAGALIYAMQRLPLCITDVSAVVIGQEGEQFRAVLGPDVEGWERVEAAARRRAWRRNSGRRNRLELRGRSCDRLGRAARSRRRGLHPTPQNGSNSRGGPRHGGCRRRGTRHTVIVGRRRFALAAGHV